MMMQQNNQDNFKGFILRGKFTDASTPDDWWLHWNGVRAAEGIVSIAECVDPVSKEFEYRNEVISSSIGYLFYENKAIERVDYISGLDPSRAINMVATFFSCSNLQSVDLTNLNIKAKSWTYLFNACNKLESAFLNCDLSSTDDALYAFGGCPKLSVLGGDIRNIHFNIEVPTCPLDYDSVMRIINALIPTEETRSLRLSTYSSSLLSEADKKIATDKGWQITT